jgi:hypothetical protein
MIIGIKYDIKHYNENGYLIDLACYKIDKELYNETMRKLL